MNEIRRCPVYRWLQLVPGGALVSLGLLATLASGAQSPARDITVEAMRTEKRVALVIGNGAYPSAPLRNPVQDARAMAQTLKALRFEVLAYENLTEKDMRRAIDTFGARLKGSGVGLFYFAGHGLQVQGHNYLVPVDSKIERETEVEYEAVDVGRVLAKMEKVNRLNIVILDACRNNPFERAWRSTGGGLAQMSAPTGTFIAYATAPGRVASDGPGANSLYTAELLKAMRVPGLTLEEVFKQAGQAVRDQTRGAQEPWIASSVYGTFVFELPARPQAVAPAAPQRPPEMEVKVLPRLGSLVIRSPKESVEVFLGERRIGEATPGADLLAENLQAGTYPLRANPKRRGFKPWIRDVSVVADARERVDIDLEILDKVIKGEDGAEMVLVPGGTFDMGSTRGEVDRVIAECKRDGESEPNCKFWFEPELPRHRVTVEAFYLDRYEVTNALFERFIGGTGHRTTAEREGSGVRLIQKDGKWRDDWVNGATWRAPSGSGSSTSPTHPVVQVSWEDAKAYCTWAGKRLPTEAEWEYAARGTDGRRYPWGEAWDPGRAYGNKTVKTATPVGKYPSGASPFGVHDMAGNVAEWTSSLYRPYPYNATDGREDPTGSGWRALRGGSWYSPPWLLRAANRNVDDPKYRGNDRGFRCAQGTKQ